MSYSKDFNPEPTTANRTEFFQAIQFRRYGSPEVLELADLAKPIPDDNEVLIRVKAAALNPLDSYYMRGSPYVVRVTSGLSSPSNSRLGADFAGIVEAVGNKVTMFTVGDSVFGSGSGAFADYVTEHEKGSIAIKPPPLSYEQAAALPIAGVTAQLALRDYGKMVPGQRVLINGASGGVGTYAVQIARTNGAIVTAVCSERNTDMVRSIGADNVIDYRKTNYTESDARYDLIVDLIGTNSFGANLGVLEPHGRLVIVGMPKGNWAGPLISIFKKPFVSPFIDQEIVIVMAQTSCTELVALANLMAAGDLVSIIDRTYPLSEVPAAMAYLEKGHARGKIVIKME
jgi:NADPH:quinone reductase-like Zn-dependent oxidoreductase